MKIYKHYKIEFVLPYADLTFIIQDDGDFVGRYRASDGRSYHNTTSLLTKTGALDRQRINFVTQLATAGLDEQQKQDLIDTVFREIKIARRRIISNSKSASRWNLLRQIFT